MTIGKKIGEKAEKINAELDGFADRELQEAQRSKFTGVWFLLGIVLVLGIILWAVFR